MTGEITTCFYKDFKFYFQSRMIYLVLLIYTAMSAGIPFYASDFYNDTTVNLYQFFRFQPSIMAMIIPALTMRLWADEDKYNTLEVLLSQPISYVSVVWGKFLAAWAVVGIMLVASMGFWLIVSLMVPLDNWWVLSNYLITFLMAGSLCAISSLAACLCYNALGAFLAALAACVVITTASFGSWTARLVSESIVMAKLTKAFDFSRQFNDMIMGQVGVAPIIYFVLLAIAALWLSAAAVEYKRS